MTKISKTKHITKKGVVKKNPQSFSARIKDLIKIKEDVTRSDLQGISMAIAMSRTDGGDWRLQSEIDNRILVIVDNSDNLTTKQINYHIKQLDEDIKRYKR